ncbi:MAG: hypothetical protein FWG50_06055 [Kiritimatiellaeota bacterium]|nr:hypothetical protein [Kiritimatiellota bacterium]
MKKLSAMFQCVCISTLFTVQSLFAAEAFYIGGGNGSFADPLRWLNAYVPQGGDTAVFLPSADGQITIPDGSPFALAAILANTNGTGRTIALYGETNTLAAPAAVEVSAGTLALRTAALTGTDGLTFSGAGGNLELQTTNFFTGPVTVLSGRFLPKFDESLGPAPATLDPAAITLDGGMLGNESVRLTVAPTRGITLGPNGGYIHGRNRGTGGLAVESPITGPGAVTIIRQTADVTFSNPGNDYAGDTILGAVMPVGYYTAADGQTLLRLGASEVIPHGPGKGRLVFTQGHDGVLDLNGFDETVNSISAPNGLFRLADASGGPPGTLRAGYDNADITLNAALADNATLDYIGTGALRVNDLGDPSSGTVSLSSGVFAFTDASFSGAALTLALNGGDLALHAHQPGLAEYRSSIGNASVNTNATDFTFTGVWHVPRMAGVAPVGYPNNTQYLYEGEWHVPAASTYSFGKSFDDGACLVIDGQTIILHNTHNTVGVVKDVYLSAGWHTLRIYVSQGGGEVGPVTPGFTSAILYDPDNGDITNGLGVAENAYPFADPGDGSVLRTRTLPALAARTPLDINASAALDRAAAPAVPFVWAADVVSAPGATLTVTGGAEPFTVGSPDRPAVFDADVSDANGIRFQDKVWVKTLPPSLTHGANADLAPGIPGLLGTGPQTLSAYSLRLPSHDALGDPALAPVTVNAGRALTFDSTSEAGSHLFDDPARAFTASNAVTLAGGTLAFDGPGTITLDAPVGGSGALFKTGSGTAVLTQPSAFTGPVTVAAGTLSVLSDAALGDPANAITLTGGAIDLTALTAFSRDLTFAPGSQIAIPDDAPFTFTGVLSGTFRKTGPAPLILAGAAPNADLDLYVAEGDVTLDTTPGPAVRNVLGVDAGASLTLAAPGQVSGNVRLTGGLLDLAGHSLAVDEFRAYEPSALANSAPGTATLTVGAGNAHGIMIGAVAPNVAIEKQGTAAFTLAAPAGASSPASVSVAGGMLALGRAPNHIRLTITRTRAANNSPRIGEIVLMRNGQPVPYRADVTTSASSSRGTRVSSTVADGTVSGFWWANGASGQFVAIDLKEPTVFDGYRLYSGINADGSSSNHDPVSWILETSSDGATWALLDTVENAALYSTGQNNASGVLIMERTLDPAVRPLVPFDPPTPVTLAAGATLRASAPAFTLATLIGAGTFDFLHGAIAALGDASAFSGAFTGSGEIVITGDTPLDIPAAPAAYVRRVFNTGTLTSEPVFQTVRSAATPATAVVGANGVGNVFAGRLAEGAAPLGLTKVGPAKTILFDTGSTYTGDTVIESGTLTVNAGACRFRYIRFNPTRTKSGNLVNSGYTLAISEFQLLAGGQPVAWPAGTSVSTPYDNHEGGPAENAINGAINDRWLSSVIPNPLTIDTQTGVIFDAYRFYDSGVNIADSNERTPATWTLEGSDDGATWLTLDAQADIATPPGHSAPGQLVGTFPLSSSPRAWFPDQFRAETSSADQHITAVTGSKFCFQVLGVRTEDTANNYGGSGYSLTALTLLRDGQVVPWPEGTTTWIPTPGWDNALGDTQRLVNNDEVAHADNNRFYSSSILNPVVINTQIPVTFDAYRWVTAASIEARDPTHWRLMVLLPDSAADVCYLLDEQAGFAPPMARGEIAGTFPVTLPAGLLAVDAIPDASRVRIAHGATLEIGAGAIETVGPLSGSGTVALATGATLGINAFEDAVFDGAIDGADATLALMGGHAQTFTSASAIPGDFTIDFRGGRFGGALHVNGALTVIGEVAYAQPAKLPAHVPLFTFASIGSDARDALINGVSSLSIPSGMVAKVTVTPTSATLSITAPGTILLLR